MKSQNNAVNIAVNDSNSNIISVLRQRAKQHGGKLAYTFLSDGEQEQASLTFEELDLRARRIAARLRQSIGVGERALLLYPPGLEYVTAFFGCLYAGVVAVPAYPPREDSGMDRIVAIANDCQFAVILTDSAREKMISRLGVALRENIVECLDTTRVEESQASPVMEWQDLQSGNATLAFLQYTSGSTALPRGVMVTHANIMHNEKQLQTAFKLSDKSVIVSWLPIYHDMGLIGAVLGTPYSGAQCILLPPVAFVQKPVRWLSAISKYRGNLSLAPNFAYDLCVRRVTEEQKADLDLSSWTAACNGAEPIRASSIEKFIEKFGPCGFRAGTMQPAYGLAEATLMASHAPYGRGASATRFDSAALARKQVLRSSDKQTPSNELVSCGRGIGGQTIRIVDPETRRLCPRNRIGEIWLSSPSVTKGYWNKPAETEATFAARLANSNEGPFLRTGDLGLLYQSELYVAGRLKDLIIINGRNHYPQDIELTVEQCQLGLRPGFGAAFSIESDGEERLVVAHEVERSRLAELNHQETIDRICQAVTQQHEVAVHAVALVMPGGIPKTSSGKIQRRLCREKFLAGKLKLVPNRAQANASCVPISPEPAGVSPVSASSAPMEFSLFYFSSNEAEFENDKYRLLMEGAKFADRHEFEAVWIPERHFHAFGGIYPNPSVLGAAVAMLTDRVRIRAGSVVLPLHNPIRVAEEWSVVDNLSRGRIDLAFARGWNPNDFALWPDRYANSSKALYEGMKTVTALWRGDAVPVLNGKGENTEIRIYPLPKQRDLQVWITCTGGIERFVEAGEGGWNVLTALLFQSVEELESKIRAYREARHKRGFDANAGRVTLMMHTFLGADERLVKETVRGPFTEYLESSVDLWRQLSRNLNELGPMEKTQVLDYAFERYYRTSALFGTPESCLEFVSRLARAGVNEIACLIDFGVEQEAVLAGLHSLQALKKLVRIGSSSENTASTATAPVSSGVENETVNGKKIEAPPVAECKPARVPDDAIVEHKEQIPWDERRPEDRELLEWVKHCVESAINRVMKNPSVTKNANKNFFSMAIDSVKAIEILDAIQLDLDHKISPAKMFDFPTVGSFSLAIAKEHKAHLFARMAEARLMGGIQTEHTPPREQISRTPAIAPTVVPEEKDDIAIIGLACKFPGAPNLVSFWDLLREGRDVTGEVPPDHWDWRPYFDPDPEADKKTYSRWGGFVDNMDLFDASFFDISPEEARAMDPQQRIFIETAWQALEHGGYSPANLMQAPVGVFVGASYNSYYQRVADCPSPSPSGAGIANQNAIIANRVSFFLNLKGPSILIDTLCSSSLIAVHLACQSLKQGECVMALAGGVNSLLSPQNYVAMSRMKIHSPDGCCRTFDHKANGVVYGEGAGAILLKPLKRALADGDCVYAVIKGSAVNHGGRSSALAAPQPQMQAQLIRKALDAAGISAESISYLEAHGTGTALGDALEVCALTRAFEHDTSRRQFCRIGSVKTNIGHLESASGIAGIIKVVLAMQNGQLPPSLHFEKPNPMISFESSPFQVQTNLSTWDSSGPRRAGISAFGIGGSNAHVILQDAPAREVASSAPAGDRTAHLLTLSAKTATALQTRARDLASFLSASPGAPLPDLCFTENTGRQHFSHRLAIVVRDSESLLAQLGSFAETGSASNVRLGYAKEGKPPKIAFVFSGESADPSGSVGVLRYEPTFRQAVERCDAILGRYPEDRSIAAVTASDTAFSFVSERIRLFVLQYALSELWKSWGVTPDVVAGFGVGEFVAAHVAGSFSLEDAIRLAVEEAKLLSRDLSNIDPSKKRTAAANSSATVLSSPQSLLDEFDRAAGRTVFLPLQIPIVSGLDGRVLRAGNFQSASSWRRHASVPPQLDIATAAIRKELCTLILNIGGDILSGEPGAAQEDSLAPPPRLQSGADDWEVLLSSLGGVYAQGGQVDWVAFDRHWKRRRLALPAYPFERQSYWIDAIAPEGQQHEKGSTAAIVANNSLPALSPMPPVREKEDILQWLRSGLGSLLRRNQAEIEDHKPLLEMGADSLALTSLMHRVESEFRIELNVWQLFVELTTLNAIAQHIVENFPLDASRAVDSAAKLSLAGDEGRVLDSGPQHLGHKPPAENLQPGPLRQENGILDQAVFKDGPLSAGQKGLWFLQRMAPDCAGYNMAAAAEIDGPLEVPALRRAFQVLVDRHPALRTTFHSQTGEPVQRVHVLMNLDFQLVQAEGEQEACMKQITDWAWQPFDLERHSPFRVVLVRRNLHEHVLLLVIHHIIADFWSFALIFDELTRLYLQETTNTAASLVSLTAFYSDYVDCQNRDLAGPRGAQLWEYWRETLKPPLAKLEIPTDHVRPPVQTFRGASQSLSLGPDLTQRLRDLAKAQHATLFMTLLASFQLLLHRYTGQNDIVVAAPAAGRSRHETANIVGYFVNPLMMRTNISGDAGFTEVLASTARSVSGALQHQDYPLPLLIERLHPARDTGGSPLFSVMFILEKAQYPELDILSSYAMGVAGPEIKVGPLSFRSLAMPERQVPFDLTLMVGEQSSDLIASIHYNRDLFEEDTVRRMLDRYRLLLSGVVADPARPIQDLPFLSDEETKQLHEWNAMENAYSSSLLHDLFRQQARQTPENVAIEDATEKLSYLELDLRSDRVAGCLINLGVGPEAVVGVCLERSVRCAVTFLGILKAGAAYLPLDPALPQSRLRLMIEDAGAEKVVTEPHFASCLPAERVLLADELERDLQGLTTAADDRLRRGGLTQIPESLAYIVYTSGSTGKPKGVQVTHRSVANFLASMARDPGLTAKDVLVSITTISFDIFGLELYLPLIVGARVVLASRETSGNGEALLELMRTCGATMMQATPATWQLLLTTAHDRIPAIAALVGGDVLTCDVARGLLAAGCRIWNLYGPSETTIWSASHRVAASDISSASVPIGRAIGNTQIYIMDANLQVLPSGIPGELVIGGDGVARGYFERPDLTAERFVPDAVSHRTGARLYRTGDLARYRPDGVLEFLGRLDNQVKVRGHRIELGEIESALANIPGIDQAVIVSRRQSSSDHRLIAYIVRDHQGKRQLLDPAMLKQILLDQLPEPFVPADFVFLDALPLTPNGKVDRKALAQREYHPRSAAAYLLPRSRVEQEIAQAWREVLKLQRVSIYDNFFDLGGHSLLLAEVHGRLNGHGYIVSILDLLRYPTISTLAGYLGSGAYLPKNVERGSETRPARHLLQRSEAAETEIAIIGMAGRFPKSANVEEFWKNILEGKECISFFSEKELAAAGIDQALLENPQFVPACGSLEDSDLFDAEFFGFNPRQAALMDPQQRLFLECSWHALENAGYDTSRYPGRIGVFAGAGMNTYLLQASHLLNASQSLKYQAFIGNDKDFLSTLVSYKLNLRGPSATVQTACSSSLVAIHLACQSLLGGECDMAMAGAVSARLPQETGHVYEEDGLLSPDGHCRAFDIHAGGTVAGSGVGVVVLKPLRAAIQDGDHICAIIKGSAINNDGNRKVGYTAPSIAGQTEVVAEALAMAGVQPETISYIETHGSGTALGDPVEIAALTDVFLTRNHKKKSCAIGSVKTNVGHLDTAAGVAGLIKTVCALEHKVLPPTLHFTAPNPQIDFDRGPFYVNTTAREWTRNGGPLRAGISSFGIGGTNAHIVLEEAPPREKTSASQSWQLLLLSARTLPALASSTQNLLEALKTDPAPDLADVAYTTQVARRPFAHRRAVLCRDRDHAIRALEQLSDACVYTSEVQTSKREVIFLFPGQGSQAIDMGRGLYEAEPVFRREMDACAEILRPHLGLDLRSILFPPPESRLQASMQLNRIEHTLPALFAAEYALACLLTELGVVPTGMLGYSSGEYVAACLAGVLSLADGLALVVARARLMQSASPGAMLNVHMAEPDLVPLLTANLSLAAVNAPSSCVVSGPEESVRILVQTLTGRGIPCERLFADRADHSQMMEPLLARFLEQVNKTPLHAPMIPYISNVTGTWITKEQSTDPKYWAEHLRKTVRFADGLDSALSDPSRLLLEVGPGHTLTVFSQQRQSQPVAIALLPPAQEQDSDRSSFLRALGQLWSEGVEIDWDKLHQPEKRKRVPLPGYPFQRRRYWIDSELTGLQKKAARTVASETKAVDGGTNAGDDSLIGTTTQAIPNRASQLLNRKESILSLLIRSMSRAVEMDPDQMDTGRSFLQMGFDSLVLMGSLQEIRRTFSVNLSLRQLFDDLNTPETLADYIDRNLPANAKFDGWRADSPKTIEDDGEPARRGASDGERDHSGLFVPTVPGGHRLESAASPAEGYGRSSSELITIMAQQTAAMNQLFQRQLEVLQHQPRTSLPGVVSLPEDKNAERPGKAECQVDETLAQSQPWVPYQPFNPGSLENLTSQQRGYLDRFVSDYVQRTKRSKESSQTHHLAHADLRTSANFRLSTKEMRYPIVGVRSKGSQIWDLDGNRYVDFTMGFGVNLFGHSPSFVMEAIQTQMEKGIQVGPQSELAGEVATLICELTGMQRVAFSNSGTEAIMAALRMARVSTGKKKVAVFAGSNHGTADSVLVGTRMENGRLKAVPLVPGVPPGMVEDMMVLNYGSARSLEMIRASAGELAAVLVEPVQSRKPELQPRAFLQELRLITEQSGIALVFDEIISGFRVHQKGAQGWFGIQADLATYGKVIGGGMPIGVIAGKSAFMDCVDGGMWTFGDMSVPSAKTTLHTGTFYKHPLSLAAGRAILLELKRRGSALFEGLNATTQRFAERLDNCFLEMEAPLKVVRFGSLFRLAGPLQLFSSDALDLLFCHLVHNGVYVWEGRNCFLSTAHSQEELDSVVEVMRESIARMRDAGFLHIPLEKRPMTKQGATQPHGQSLSSRGSSSVAPGSSGQMELTLQTPAAQRELWLMSRSSREASLSYNQAIPLRLRGRFDREAFAEALTSVTTRHEALRTVFDSAGEWQRIQITASPQVAYLDLAAVPADAQGKAVSEWFNRETEYAFDLTDHLLWRAAILKLKQEEHLVVLTIHHTIADGLSTGVLLHEIGMAYSARVTGQVAEFPPALQPRDYVKFLEKHLDEPVRREAASYWLRKLQDSPEVRLPMDSPRSTSRSGTRLSKTLEPSLKLKLSALSSQFEATLFVTLLAAYHFFLSRITGEQDLVIVTPVAGQMHMDSPTLVGDCSNLIGLRARLTPDITFAAWIDIVKKQMIECADYQLYPLAEVIRKLRPRRDPSRWFFFNIDRSPSPMRLTGIDLEYVPFPIAYTAFDFGVNITILSGGIEIAFDYRTALFRNKTISQWFNEFEDLLHRVTADPHLSLSEWAKGQPARVQVGDNEIESSYVAPRTQVEQMVAAIWEEVLGRDRISIFSDFFELGGHSLLATQMVSRMRDIFGIDLSLEDLFQQPSIVGLAGIVEKSLRKRERRAQESIPRGSHDRPLPVSFAQRRLWLIHQLDPKGAAYNITGAIRLSGVLDYAAMESALDDLTRRHESLRTVFLKGETEPVQQVLPHKTFRLERLDISGAVQAEERSSVLVAHGQEAARQPFDLARGPLFRAQLLKFSEDDHALIIAIHHIVCDGWSAGIILREIGLLYDAFCSKKSVDLRALPIQFADYAVWQRRWLQGEILQGQLDYWVQQLAGAQHFLKLPTDRPRTAAPSFKGAHEPFELDEPLSAAVWQFCRPEGVTPFMTLLAGFSLLLARYSGQDDVIVGTDIANRDRLETEDLVGCFVNLLPVRLRPAEHLTFREYVRQVRKVTLDAYHHQDAPFDLLVRALRPERKLTTTPLVQVLFVLHNLPLPSVKSDIVKMEPVLIPMETSEFELILSMQEEGNKFIGTMGYSTDLYDRSRICSLVLQFQELLRLVMGASDTVISSLDGGRVAKTQSATAVRANAGLSSDESEVLDKQIGTST